VNSLSVHLLDGRTLLIDAGGGLDAGPAAELEIWALVPDTADLVPGWADLVTIRGDLSFWREALKAGPLVSAVFDSLSPDRAAERAFPQASRLLANLRAASSRLDAVGAAKVAIERVAELTGEDPKAIGVNRSSYDNGGVWTVELVRPSRASAKVTLRGSGWATLIDLGQDAATDPDPGQRVLERREARPPTRGVDADAPAGPRAFICYAHDSDDHKRAVAAFAAFLGSQGVDIHFDSMDEHGRRDWQLWATGQITSADFVLVIASPQCRLVGDGDIPADEYRGLRAEMNTLRELYFRQPHVWPARILPVVLPGGSVDDLPLFLQPWTSDHYVIADLSEKGARALLHHLRPPGRPDSGPAAAQQ
jgi:hypothetical protein